MPETRILLKAKAQSIALISMAVLGFALLLLADICERDRRGKSAGRVHIFRDSADGSLDCRRFGNGFCATLRPEELRRRLIEGVAS